MERIELVVALIVLVLEIYSVVNCILTPDTEVKHIPKAIWLVLILLLPLIGSVLWLGVGRDRDAVARRSGSTRTLERPSAGYSAMRYDDRIRQMEEDLARLEAESTDEDGAAPRA